jgi:integrase
VIDFDPDAKTLTIAKQLVYDDWKSVEEADPKTESSSADVPLDEETAGLLKASLAWRAAKRGELGEAWTDSGRLFTRADGSWIHPGWLSEEFERLVQRSGLPPVRLHDLRHGAATLMLAAGADIKIVQETLRHSSRVITSDLYTSVLPELAYAAAEASVKLVPRTKSAAHAPALAG